MSDASDMSQTNRASQQYLRSAVMTASPEQLHLMLLDGGIRFCHKAIEAIDRRDIEGSYNALERAQRIVVQLSAGLRRDVNPELVDQMSALYEFILNRLVQANTMRQREPVEDAIRILQDQRQTWALLIEKLASEAPPTTSLADAAAAGPSPADRESPGDPPGRADGASSICIEC